MAEFGADVIKVELPGQGDGTRYRHPLVNGHSVAWAMRARNKRGITLDVRTEKGRALFLRLVRESDVVVENFRSGTLEKWGLGWDVLQAENPRLILVRVSGFGQDGPYANRSAFDRIGLAMAGFTHVNGSPERPPLRPGVLLSDYSSALFGVLGVMALLHRRARTGRGGVVDLGIYESVLRMMGDVAAVYDRHGVVRQRQGALWPGYGFFVNAKAADGLWVAVSAREEETVAAAVQQLGMPQENGTADTLRAWIATLPGDEAVARLRLHGVACSVVQTVDRLVQDPHVQARRNCITLNDANLGPVTVQGPIPHLSLTPGQVTRGGPGLGEHNQDVYGELLGLTADEMEALKQENVI